MFGQFDKLLDDKKRLVLPSKLRKGLGNTVYITFSPDGALELRGKEEFLNLKNKLLSNNTLSKLVRQYSRILFSNTAELNIDKIGRINLPENLLKKASIKKGVTIIGVGNKIEIWSKESFEKIQSQFDEMNKLDEIAEKLYKDGVAI